MHMIVMWMSCDQKRSNENVCLAECECQDLFLVTLLMVPESTNLSELEKKSFRTGRLLFNGLILEWRALLEKTWLPIEHKELNFETLVPKKFYFLSARSNQGLKFETLVQKYFDFLSPGSNKGLKFETLVRQKFGFLSPWYS